MNSLLADVIVTVHFAWIAYVVVGQLLILLGIPLRWEWTRNFWFRFTHLSMMLLVAVEVLYGVDCPLTVWENEYSRGMQSGENRSFIAEWIGKIIFYDLDGGDWPFVVGYLTFSALVVWSIWQAPPRMHVSKATFVALVHLFIGGILLATAWSQNPFVGVCFLVQAGLWYGVQFVNAPTWPMSPATIVALVHLGIGVVWISSAWPSWGPGACFVAQAIAWYVLQFRKHEAAGIIK